MGIRSPLPMIEYFRLNIEYLWNAVDLKKTERSDSIIRHFSIVNRHFFVLRLRQIQVWRNYKTSTPPPARTRQWPGPYRRL